MGSLSGAPGSSSCGCGPSKSHSDNHMISKSLRSLSAQADEINKRMACGSMELPSWAEYKVYKAHDAIKDALSATYGAEPKRKMMIIIRKSHDSGAKDALEDAGLSHSVTGEKTASLALSSFLDKVANMREDHLEFLAQNPSRNSWKDKGVGVLSMNLRDGSATAHTSGEMRIRDVPETYRRKLLGLGVGVPSAGIGGLLGGALGALGSTYLGASDENKRLATALGLFGGAALGGAGGGYYGYQQGKMQDEMSSITPEQVQGAMKRLNSVEGVRVPSVVQDPGGDSLRFYHHDAPDSPGTIRAINKAIYGE